MRLSNTYQQRALERRRGRKRLWRLELLEEDLVQEPVATDKLAQAFAELPILAPVGERIVAAIIGVPVERGGEQPS